MSGYSDFVESWLSKNPSYRIDSKEKLNALKAIFSDSHIALIYGSAGTGKSTLINHISNLYNDRKKLYLANTNPAVDNMRRKVNAGNCDFKTIAKFLSDYNTDTECDILFIDECSTVSNKDKLCGRHGGRADADDVFVLLHGVLRPRHRVAAILDDVSGVLIHGAPSFCELQPPVATVEKLHAEGFF